MAPNRPAVSKARRAVQTSRPARPATSYPSATQDSFFSATSKKDKQRIKRSQFLSRVQKASEKPGAAKRRRPSKKLVATLENLVDALPLIASKQDATGNRNVVSKAIASKPGAGKKRIAMEQTERARFSRNLALLNHARSEAEADQATDSAAAAATDDRWAALRKGIASNMGVPA